MTLKKTSELAKEFGYCKKTMQKILQDMARPDSNYRFDVIPPVKQGDSYRADPAQVHNYLLGRRS